MLGTLLFGGVHRQDRVHPYHRLVSGLYCDQGSCRSVSFPGTGTGPVIQQMLRRLCQSGRCTPAAAHTDDQRELTQFYLKCHDCIVLDHHCRLFYNIDWPDGYAPWRGHLSLLTGVGRPAFPVTTDRYRLERDDQSQQWRVVVSHSGERPLFLHANGDVDIDPIVVRLGYPPREVAKRQYFRYATLYYVVWRLTIPLLVLLILCVLVLTRISGGG